MDFEIDLIADKLIRDNCGVVLYGADADALLIMKSLERRFQIKPTFLCDSDRKKWHKSLMGVEILSLDEIITKCPDAFFFISSGFYKYQIIGNLLSNGNVSAERILNFEPVTKRRSCIYLESYIACANHLLNFCCSDFGKNRSPFIRFKGDYELAVDEFIAYRDQLIDDLSKGDSTPCDGCPCIKEDWYASDRKIRIINNAEDGICNFKCCYCKSPAITAKDITNDIIAEKLLVAFRSRNLLPEELYTIISCGEVCVHPGRKEIYNAIRNSRNTICTNGSICDQGILQLLKLGKTELIISIDAGTRNTFKIVKGHDLFDRVCENIKRYSSNGEVKLKYILLPGINDNKDDIDGFISLCRDAGTNLVQVSYDLNAPRELNVETRRMARYLVDRLSENGLLYRVISDVIHNAVIENGEEV